MIKGKSILKNIFDSLFAINARAYTGEEYDEAFNQPIQTNVEVDDKVVASNFLAINDLLKQFNIVGQIDDSSLILSFSFISDKGSTTYAEDYQYYSDDSNKVKYEDYHTKVSIEYDEKSKKYTIKESGFTSTTDEEVVSLEKLKEIIESERWLA